MDDGFLFSGNAIDRVDADGSVSLPGFVRRVVGRERDERRLIVGAHEIEPCLTAYEPEHRQWLEADLERRRLYDEAAGNPVTHHYGRARRAFGFVEEAELNGDDRLTLPPIVRRRAAIDDWALFVGTGSSFEIWNPRLALETGDETLRALAHYRLEQASITLAEEKDR